MRKLTSLIVAATLAVGAANIVHAANDNLTPPPAGGDKPMMHKPPRHGGGMHDMFKGLNLTDAQKQQIRTIMKESHKDMKRPSLEERRAMHSIIASDTFDRAKAEAQATQMAANGKERALSMLETQNKMYNVLTPEQKKQFNQDFEKRLTEKPKHEGKMPPADD
ncbi:ATP-independent periplasmic protein-refolding chaperone [Erwinia sp. S43]|uniref:ATP-independent periplasmic protein-refolding chaperone n=1 Tax=Pantoea coffeiphila TaxID=1465635 RepID=A0A2S9I647_9GAMM|nr:MULTISPECIES: ATP-independent periplasmic protein-refolding chaperone Spy [Erwiniaceae]MBK0000581.1 ATP-independent periplasmic protein-refolding chaperone [Erwinia sp. S38]MBK0030671.1 ATP-independent periplasmic protein-refolding chaperone [Erwinia sp. S43]MBM7341717.1 Spy/CpxP family protein refolding chaperone [Pantoea coffeiphila]MCW1874837.1 ATP-independent periplasmic protein-refolding chaperone Spy [Erwinia sp. INIA01]PRD13273.1 ATP-independent periplasmic protein-refolding chaperon